MLSSRHHAVLKEIDTARCVGRWSALGELATRYAKHAESGQVFSLLVTSEALLEEKLQSVKWSARKHWKGDGEMTANGRILIAYPMNIASSTLLADIESDLQNAGKRKMTSEEGYQYKVVLAKVYFYAAQFAKCREIL
ncbi:hypothetical protein FBU59_006514, partial [Linderina macrospora]